MNNAVFERNKLLLYVLRNCGRIELPSDNFLKELSCTEESLAILNSINVDYVLDQIQSGHVVNIKQFYRMPPTKKPLPTVDSPITNVPPRESKPLPIPTKLPEPDKKLPPPPIIPPKVLPMVPMIKTIAIEDLEKQVIGSEDTNIFDLAWKMTQDELIVSSYESFLLSTNLLTSLNDENLTTALTLVRNYLKVTSQQHAAVMTDLIINPDIANNISYTIDPDQYANNMIRHPNREKMTIELDSMRRISYRWKLVTEFATKGTRKVDFFERQLKVFCNCVISLIRKHGGTYNVTFDKSFKQMSADQVEKLFLTSCQSLLTAIQDNSPTLNTQIKELDELQKSLPFDRHHCYPLNVHLYAPILTCRVRQSMTTDGNSNAIRNCLKLMKDVLSISDDDDRTCFVMQLYQMAKTEHYEQIPKLEEMLAKQLYNIADINSDFKRIVASHIRKHYGTYLTDFVDSIYSADEGMFERHLNIYFAIVNEHQLCKNMVQVSVTKDYERTKGTIWKAPDNRYLRLGKEMFEGIDMQKEIFYDHFSDYYQNATLDAVTTMLTLYIRDLCEMAHNETSLSTDLLEALQILKKFLSVLADESASIKDIIPIFKPLQDAMNPILTRWINTVQDNFDSYLARAVKLENWQAVSGSKHSTSLIDLFTFLEQPLPLLHKMILPNSGSFYRAYAQCMSGMVQKYGFLVVEGIPKSADLIPMTPSYSPGSPKNIANIGKLLIKKAKTLESDKNSKSGDKRLELGKKFAYEELFVRLNNLTGARKRFIENLTDLKRSWTQMRNLFLLKKDEHTDTESQDDHTNTETESVAPIRLTKPTTRIVQTVEIDIDSSMDSDTEERDTETQQTEAVTETIHAPTLPSDDSLIPNVDFDNLITVTSTLLLSIITDLCDYIGTRNIYIEMYDQLFETLYFPSVKASPFSPILSRYFDPCLNSLCDLAPDSYTVNLVIKSMFRKLIRSLYTVIQDGGRTFQLDDSIILLKDLDAIEKFFYGEAIKQMEYISHYTLKLKGIIAAVMDKTTRHLIEGGPFNEMFARLPDKKPEIEGSPWTKQIVWKVINGRKSYDPLAKKFIKNNPYRFD